MFDLLNFGPVLSILFLDFSSLPSRSFPSSPHRNRLCAKSFAQKDSSSVSHVKHQTEKLNDSQKKMGLGQIPTEMSISSDSL